MVLLAFATPSSLNFGAASSLRRPRIFPRGGRPVRTAVPVASVNIVTERGQKVLSRLLHANARYVNGVSDAQSELSPMSLRENLALNGQTPEAAIIACADSRVAPEIIFNAGIGKVFVIRNAGNVAYDDSVIGSLEFAVQYLDVPLVIVLGHTLCGAVSAAVETAKPGIRNRSGSGSPLANHVRRLADVVAGDANKENAVSEAVVTNVKDGVARLKGGDTAVGEFARNGNISIVGAVYDIYSGKVSVVE